MKTERAYCYLLIIDYFKARKETPKSGFSGRYESSKLPSLPCHFWFWPLAIKKPPYFPSPKSVTLLSLKFGGNFPSSLPYLDLI